MKELLKRIKRDTEKELSRIRNELKNINENSKEHVVVLKNSEKFLKQDLETLKKGVCEESIEVLLKHLRIEDEDTKATEDDVLGIGKHYMNKELFSKAKDLYKKVLNNNAFKIDSSYKNTIKKIINNDDSSNKLAKGGLNLFEEAYEKYEKRNYEKAFNLYEKAWNEYKETSVLHNIGCMYFFGEGVKKDHRKTIEYWELGVKNNLDISQFNMGIVHLGLEKLEVDGFETDFNKGVELLSRAANQGNEKAILLLEKIKDKEEIIMKTITNIREIIEANEENAGCEEFEITFNHTYLKDKNFEKLKKKFCLKLKEIIGIDNFNHIISNENEFDNCLKNVIRECNICFLFAVKKEDRKDTKLSINVFNVFEEHFEELIGEGK